MTGPESNAGQDLDPAPELDPVQDPNLAQNPVADAQMVADAVATVTRSVPGVTALHTGAFGEVATYLPGRKVSGVRLADDVTEVHVTVLMGVNVLNVAQAVQAVVQPLVRTPVHVYVEDVTAR